MDDEGDRPQGPSDEPGIEEFLGEPTRDLERWSWLWTEDRTFPVRSHRGLLGRGLVFLKRLLRPVARAVLADLWDRQRVFNLILLDTIVNERHQRRHLSQRAEDFQGAIETHAELLAQLDRRTAEAMTEVLRHNDALFSRVDQKLDRYRREAKDLWHRLGALVAASEKGDSAPVELRRTQEEQGYLELERRYRGSEEEIAERVAAYLPVLEKAPGTVLDLGCGRGEALEVFRGKGIEVRGVDTNAEMVARCQAKGLDAEEGDLFAHLSGLEEASLGAIASFHVIEHLPAEAVARLVRLAWRALKPGGVLILETPSPLSLVMSARDFWIDPTHRRPVHPASLEVAFREAGFEPVSRVDLHPFPTTEHLPEIDLAELPAEQRELGDHVNRLRDLLDDLLFGHRDFAMVGKKG